MNDGAIIQIKKAGSSETSSSSDGNPPMKKALPDDALSILKSWLFSPEHVRYPFPTAEESKQLIASTGLTALQVKNWFTNARRRVWKRYCEEYNIVPAVHKERSNGARDKRSPNSSSSRSAGIKRKRATPFSSTAPAPVNRPHQDQKLVKEGTSLEGVDMVPELGFVRLDDPIFFSRDQVHPKLNSGHNIKPTNCFEDFPVAATRGLAANAAGFILDRTNMNTQPWEQQLQPLPQQSFPAHIPSQPHNNYSTFAAGDGVLQQPFLAQPLPAASSSLGPGCYPFSHQQQVPAHLQGMVHLTNQSPPLRSVGFAARPSPAISHFVGSSDHRNMASFHNPIGHSELNSNAAGQLNLNPGYIYDPSPGTSYKGKCLICNNLDQPQNTHVLNCGHTFHSECLNLATMFDSPGEQAKCPHCNAPSMPYSTGLPL